MNYLSVGNMYPSKMEQLIIDRSFSYLQPYFYNHPYALRCELGIGKDQEYINNAKKRAVEIYDILFPNGADAIIFNYWHLDRSNFGTAEKNTYANDPDFDMEGIIDNIIQYESKQLRFLLECQRKYETILSQTETIFFAV